MHNPIIDKISKQLYKTFQEYEQDILVITDKYQKSAKGPAKETILKHFVEQLKSEREMLQLQLKVDAIEVQKQEQEQKNKVLKLALDESKQQEHQAIQARLEQQQKNEQEMESLKERKEIEMQQYKLEQERILKERETEMEKWKIQGVKDTAEMFRGIIQEMHESFKQKDAETAQLIKNFNAQILSQQQALNELMRTRDCAPPTIRRNNGAASAGRCGAITTKGTPCKNRAGSCPHHR